MLERTLIWNQMRDLLAYWKWYAELISDAIHGFSPCDIIDRALSPPFVYTDWVAFRHRERELIRFGYIWKVYDRVAKKGLGWAPPVIGEPRSNMVFVLWESCSWKYLESPLSNAGSVCKAGEVNFILL